MTTMGMLRAAASAAAILALSGSIGASAAERSHPDMPPTLSLPDEHGGTVSPDAFKGQVLLLDVWASWCAPCQAAFPGYNDLLTRYRSQGFHVLAVNVDERRQDADRFLAERPHQVQVVFDPQGRVPQALKMSGMPTSYLIDRRGRIRFVHEGFTERTLDTYRREIEQLLREGE